MIDPTSNRVRYALAGHPPPLLVARTGAAAFLEAAAACRSASASTFGPTDGELTLAEGDLLLLYTDGLVEKRTQQLGEGLDRLLAVASAAPADPDAFVDHLLAAMVPEERRSGRHRRPRARPDAHAAPDGRAGKATRLPRSSDREHYLAAASRCLRCRSPFPPMPAPLPSCDSVSTSWLQGLGADERSRADIVLSAWEGCANAMEHAGSTEPIRVDAFASAGGVCVRIRDKGRWLDRGNALERSGVTG